MNTYPQAQEPTERAAAWRRRLQRGAALALLVALQACSFDDDPTPLVATADSLTLDVGQSADLLANDRVGDAVATPGAGGNAVFALGSASLPAWLDVAAGVVTVQEDAVPGQINFEYSLCEAASPAHCASASVVLNVPAPPVTAAADSFVLSAGSSAEVLANDTLGGVQASADRVTVAAIGALPAGVTLSAAGLVTVAAGIAPGTYSIDYRICQIVAPANCAQTGATVVVPSLAILSGRLVDANTALGIAGARVSASGVSATTDSAGAYTLSGLPTGDRITVLFGADNYADTARIASAMAQGSADVSARLVPLGAASDVAADAGGTISVSGSAAMLVLPPSAVQLADGSIPSGNVRVRLTPIDPSADSSLLPGDFTALLNASVSLIESFGAVDVSLVDGGGAPVTVRSGQLVTLRIPAASRSGSYPTTAVLYGFDLPTGRWIEGGTGTLAGSGASRYYEGTVNQFGIWTAGRVLNSVRVSGCLVDANGAPVSGGQIRADGVDYTGTSSAVTDVAGNFVIAVRNNGVATLVGQGNGLASNTLRAGPYGADAQIQACMGLGQTGAGVTMKLTWGGVPSDLDSHLYAPDGTHVYFGSRGALLTAPYANLDVDDTSSYGPEVITITRLMVGSYAYAVHNFSGQSRGFIGVSGARLEFTLPGRALELLTPPSSGESAQTAWWRVLQFDVDSHCNVSVNRTNAFSSSAPPASATGTAVYCVP